MKSTQAVLLVGLALSFSSGCGSHGKSKSSAAFASTTAPTTTTSTTAPTTTTSTTAPTTTSTIAAPTPQPTAAAPPPVLPGTGFFTDGGSRFPSIAAGQNDWTVAAGDVDGDGLTDVVFGNIRGAPRLMRNSGTGFVADPAAFPTTQISAVDSYLVDMDLDGDLDWVASGDAKPVLVYLNDGTGKFQHVSTTPRASPPGTIHFGNWHVAIGDANGDGFPDVYLPTSGSITTLQGQDVLLLNDGAGALQVAPTGGLPVELDDSHGAVFLDLEQDGDLDVFVANLRGVSRLKINDGTGKFTNGSPAALPVVDGCTSVASADLNNDGSPDLFVTRYGDPAAGAPNAILLNDGTGRFRDASAMLPRLVEKTYDVRLVDVNGDRFVDALLVGETHQRLYLNQRGTSFLDVTPLNLPAMALDPTIAPRTSKGLAIADFNGDRSIDVVFARRQDAPFLFLNRPR